MRIGRTLLTLEAILVAIPIALYGAIHLLGYLTQHLDAFAPIMAVLAFLSSVYFIPVAKLFPSLFQQHAFVLVPSGSAAWLAVAGFYSLCAFGIGSALLAIVGPEKKRQGDAEQHAGQVSSEAAPSAPPAEPSA